MYEEYEFVGYKIAQLAKEEGFKYSDVAVLYRNNK